MRGLEGQVDESVVSYDDMVGNGSVNHVYNINGVPRNDAPSVKSSTLYGSAESIESDKGLYSEDGYSASEEEGNLRDRQILTRNRRKTKSKNGSLGRPNGFVKSAYV